MLHNNAIEGIDVSFSILLIVCLVTLTLFAMSLIEILFSSLACLSFFPINKEYSETLSE